MAPRLPWPGGPCPLNPETRVSITYRDGIVSKPRIAGLLRWEHAGLPDDIVAYEALWTPDVEQQSATVVGGEDD